MCMCAICGSVCVWCMCVCVRDIYVRVYTWCVCLCFVCTRVICMCVMCVCVCVCVCACVWSMMYDVWCAVCAYKGVKSSGKVVWITVPLPFILLIILFFRGVTLEGAGQGIEFYLKPDFSLVFTGMVYGVWCVMHDAWCMMYDVWRMMYDVWCMMYDVWCVMCDVWCML